MKKFFLILTSLILVCSFVGCTGENEPEETKQIVGGGTTPSQQSPSETTTSEPSENITIQEQVCFDHDGIKVTAKSITTDSIWGTGIKLLVENNTSKDYSIGVNEVIVNNCMASSLFSCKVAAGKKTNDTLYLSDSSLKAAGITNIGQIEIYFYVYDSSTYSTVYNAECTTIKTSFYDKMDPSFNNTGREIYNKDGIRIIGKYVDEDTLFGSSIVLCVENKTNQNITVSCDDISINGYMVSGLLASTVYSGKYAIDDITIFSGELEGNGITSIDTVELKFRIYDSETFKTIVNTEPIQFSTK